MTEGMVLCFSMLPSVGAPTFFNRSSIFCVSIVWTVRSRGLRLAGSERLKNIVVSMCDALKLIKEAIIVSVDSKCLQILRQILQECVKNLCYF
jgi:hypothetical protein